MPLHDAHRVAHVVVAAAGDVVRKRQISPEKMFEPSAFDLRADPSIQKLNDVLRVIPETKAEPAGRVVWKESGKEPRTRINERGLGRYVPKRGADAAGPSDADGNEQLDAEFDAVHEGGVRPFKAARRL